MKRIALLISLISAFLAGSSGVFAQPQDSDQSREEQATARENVESGRRIQLQEGHGDAQGSGGGNRSKGHGQGHPSKEGKADPAGSKNRPQKGGK